MTKRQQWPLSRLAGAWLALSVCLGVGAFVVWLAPARDNSAENGVAVVLPAEPDRYAASDPTPTSPALVAPQSENSAGGKPDGKAINVKDILASQSAPQAAPQSGAQLDQESDVLDALTDPLAAEGAGKAPDDAVVITIPGVKDLGQKAPQAPRAADPRLQINTAQGVRPHHRPGGERPFDAYRRREKPAPGVPAVALMVSGLGLDPAITQRAIDVLPPSISLSFAPYTKDLDVWVEKAVAKGHEVAIELPMEERGVGGKVLGPAALMIDRPAAANEERLEWILSRAPAYPMVTNYLGTTFSADAAALAPVLAKLKEAGLAYLDDTGHGAIYASAAKVPNAAVALVLPPGSENAMGALDELAIGAVVGDPPVAKVYAGAGGLEAALAWAETAPARGFAIVPASEAIKGSQ
ncbi:MAG: divergent polysaccharide deacetylase family protein [Pseudomonadota bacterium]